ncbi:hypothetical protein P8918_13050 [Bacillus spizizenii]|nr:hypothetical protein [Bacillus spizizenii]MCY8890498.1 hypothetical protein [Bacillus spizizenii]MEC0841953.1 hypothetical protein [Bacillus spizizenii]
MNKTKEIMEEIESMKELNDGSLFINAEKYIDHVTYLLNKLNNKDREEVAI